jgi:hypothetical protein
MAKRYRIPQIAYFLESSGVDFREYSKHLCGQDTSAQPLDQLQLDLLLLSHRGGEADLRGAAATNEETTAPAEGDRPKAQTAQKPVGFDEEVVSPLAQANLPAAFGQGSLGATGFDPRAAACDDVKGVGEAACGVSVPGEEPVKTLLKRVDPQTGEVVPKIDVDRGAVDIAADESSGAVWVAGVTLNYDKPENNKLSRVNPATNRVVAEIPIRAGVRYGGGASNVAVGEGAVWVLSSDARLLKVDPATNEIAGMVSVGDSSSQLVVYGGGVWALVQASAPRNHPKPGRSKMTSAFRLVRVDPRTMHVVASEYLRPFNNTAPGGLAAGGGYLWFSSGGGLARVSP